MTLSESTSTSSPPPGTAKMMTALPTLRRKILRSFLWMVVLYGILGFFLVIGVKIASGTSPRMIHVNYDSIAASAQMRDSLFALRTPQDYPQITLNEKKEILEKALTFEEGNETETGEKEIAQGIRSAWDSIKKPTTPPSLDQFAAMNRLLDQLVLVNERGMFNLADSNESLSRRVMLGSVIFFLLSLVTAVIFADSLSRRIAEPLKNIAEALHRRPAIGRRLKLIVPDTLELMILTTELNRLWERVNQTEKVNVQELIRQKSKLESVLESVEDALFVIDNEGLVTQANQCFQDLISLPLDKIRRQKWTDLPTLNDNYLRLRSLLSQDTLEGSETELDLKEKKRQYAARTRDITAPGGVPVARLYLLHDITEKRQRESFRSDFIDLLSHELKTPLQSLGTATELLVTQRDSLPEVLKPLVETISEDVERIKAVANEFVQVTQSHSKILKIKLDKTALNQVINEWVKPFKVVAKDRKVRLTVKQEGSDIIWANLDCVKFPWVLSNLLSNAIRFAPTDSEVDVLITDRNGAVEIQVRDEGPGISDEDQRRMFDPFFQGTTMTTTSGNKGLFGIGLTIAKEVVEAHDGRIEYYRRQPRGSEFRIILPFPVG
jgi:NtrC-family two-component system sensor histidine kinase KinB